MNDNGWHEEDVKEEVRPGWRDRLRGQISGYGSHLAVRADHVERNYLALLRYALLIAATLLLVVALVLLLWGAVRQIGPSDAAPEPVRLTSADVAPDTPTEAEFSDAPVETRTELLIPESLRAATAEVYKTRFAPFERAGDDLKDAELVDAVWTQDRIAAFRDLPTGFLVDNAGETFPAGVAVNLHAIQVAADATEEPGLARSLAAYRAAKQIDVCRDVVRDRTRTEEYWNDYSMSCDGWYYYPQGCMDTRTVSEPYTTKICEKQFPADLSSPAEAFGDTLDNYLLMASLRQDLAISEASEREAELKAAKVSGQASISDSGKLFLAFLALMLVYLLVVMERHHRVLRRLVERQDDDDGAGNQV